MGKFFDYNNKFFYYSGKAIDCVLLSFVFLISCLPVFTIGAAITALYYSVHHAIRRDHSYPWEMYVKGFKENFKQSTKMWLIQLVAIILIVLDIRIMMPLLEQGHWLGMFVYVFIALLCMAVTWAILTMSYTARFELDWKHTMRNGMFMLMGRLQWSVLIFGVLVLTIVLVPFVPISIFITPALGMVVDNIILERIFRTLMTEEELQAEHEMDWEIK